MSERYQAPSEAFAKLGQFPHCDPRVLHAPTQCEYCDRHPTWQALRQVWAINFTNESNPQKAPCPSTLERKAYEVNRWAGNRPSVGGVHPPVEVQPPTAWAHLDNELEDE